jgi:hypothetical protein
VAGSASPAISIGDFMVLPAKARTGTTATCSAFRIKKNGKGELGGGEGLEHFRNQYRHFECMERWLFLMKSHLECMSSVNGNSDNALVAEAGAHCNALAANGTATAQYSSAGLGLHARAEPVCFHTVAAVGLKCALGHGIALLFPL